MTMHDFKLIKENTTIHEKWGFFFFYIQVALSWSFKFFFFINLCIIDKNTDEKIHNHITVDQQIPNTYYQS